MMNDFEQRVLEDLAVLKAQMHTLVGNGKPGTIAEHSARLEKVERFRERVLGVFIFIMALATIAGALAVIR